MARYHVRADGSMGVCTAKEGNCPFSGETGTRHFTNEVDAKTYSEETVKAIEVGKTLGGGFKRLLKESKDETSGLVEADQSRSTDDVKADHTKESVKDDNQATHDDTAGDKTVVHDDSAVKVPFPKMEGRDVDVRSLPPRRMFPRYSRRPPRKPDPFNKRAVKAYHDYFYSDAFRDYLAAEHNPWQRKDRNFTIDGPFGRAAVTKGVVAFNDKGEAIRLFYVDPKGDPATGINNGLANLTIGSTHLTFHHHNLFASPDGEIEFCIDDVKAYAVLGDGDVYPIRHDGGGLSYSLGRSKDRLFWQTSDKPPLTMDDLHLDNAHRSQDYFTTVTGDSEDFGAATRLAPSEVLPTAEEEYAQALENPDDPVARVAYDMNRFGVRGSASFIGIARPTYPYTLDDDAGKPVRMEMRPRGLPGRTIDVKDGITPEASLRMIRNSLMPTRDTYPIEAEQMAVNAITHALHNAERQDASSPSE